MKNSEKVKQIESEVEIGLGAHIAIGYSPKPTNDTPYNLMVEKMLKIHQSELLQTCSSLGGSCLGGLIFSIPNLSFIKATNYVQMHSNSIFQALVAVS
jgi:hypothetical protein